MVCLRSCRANSEFLAAPLHTALFSVVNKLVILGLKVKICIDLQTPTVNIIKAILMLFL